MSILAEKKKPEEIKIEIYSINDIRTLEKSQTRILLGSFEFSYKDLVQAEN